MTSRPDVFQEVTKQKRVATTTPPPLMGPMPITTFGEEDARYWRDGVVAKEDYRYWAICMYLKLSPSFYSVLRHIENKKNPFPLPDDLATVKPVVQDFRHILRMEPWVWWKKHGKYLFGTPAPIQKLYVAGNVTASRRSLSVMWDQHDSVVARIAVNQTKKEALAALEVELDRLIAMGQFSIPGGSRLKAKYEFTPSRIRRSTLGLGYDVLNIYQSKNVFPLWWIGNLYNVSPAMRITAEDLQTLDDSEIAYRKQVLGITTSRIVNNAMLIAENAARGRFPCNEAFPEAMLNVFERRVGRPGKRRK